MRDVEIRFEMIAEALEDAGIEVESDPVSAFDEIAIVAGIRTLAVRARTDAAMRKRWKRHLARVEYFLECSEKDVANEQRRRDEARAEVEAQAERIVELEAEIATLKAAKKAGKP